MNVELVRIIDYWLGIPLCFVLSLIDYALRLVFFKKKRKSTHQKFLFIQLSEMGTAILAYPTMKYIKEQYSNAQLFYMIFKKNRASVDLLGQIPRENILTINDKSLFMFFTDTLKNMIRIRKEKIEIVFDLELFSRATAILTFLTGAPIKVGFHRYRMEGLYRGSFFTHKVQYNFQQHLSKAFLSFAKVLREEKKTSPTMAEEITSEQIVPMRYDSAADRIDSLWRKLENINPRVNNNNTLIILNPSAGLLPIRAWPLENYVSLGRKIINNPGNYIILTGTDADRPITEKLYQALNSNNCIDLTGKTTFMELVDLYNVADVLVTNDSGPAHFASLTRIKNFVFFGPETPVLYAPLGENTRIFYSNFPCSPCITAFNHRNTTCVRSRCLEAISIDEVYALLTSELSAISASV